MPFSTSILFLLLQEVAEKGGETSTWKACVRDAFTGARLAEVHCEVWSEDPYASPRLVAEGWTGAEGTCELALAAHGGQKVLLRKAGYRSTEHGISDDELALFPALDAFEWRLVDLEGRPIPGAVVRTRQSCRHAVPAVEARSDVRGWVRIDDLPPLVDGPELEILADGFGALGALPAGELLDLGEIALPRRAPLELRCLDGEGRPIGPGRLRYEAESGGYPLGPDALGNVRLAALFERRHGLIVWQRDVHDPPSRQLEELPSRGPSTLRFDAPGPAACDAEIELACRVEAGEAVRLIHEQGWVFRGPGLHRVPSGVLELVVGAPFSGVRERVTRLELAPGERLRREIVLEREPVLHLSLPAEPFVVHVQAGADSVTLFPSRLHPQTLETPVPPDEPLIAYALGRESHRARLDPLAPQERSASLDLASAATLVGSPHPGSGRLVDLRFAVRGAGETPPVEASATSRDRSWPDLDPTPGGVLFRLPEGAHWEASFAVQGYPTLHRAGRAGAARAGTEEILLPLP